MARPDRWWLERRLRHVNDELEFCRNQARRHHDRHHELEERAGRNSDRAREYEERAAALDAERQELLAQLEPARDQEAAPTVVAGTAAEYEPDLHETSQDSQPMAAQDQSVPGFHWGTYPPPILYPVVHS